MKKVKFLADTPEGIGKGSVLEVRDRYADRLIKNNEAQAAKNDEPVKFNKVKETDLLAIKFDSSTQTKGKPIGKVKSKKQEEKDADMKAVA